ncbi:MAG: DUF4214 domain-containing protein, partial [Acidobacteria bacterium]|nr:DUF4214 domain-containing protein [Acidobacteriota bacterium]
MNNCPPGQICDPVDTSQRFFESDEFQERGFYVYLLYDAVMGRLPLYKEFVPDVARLNGFQNVTEQRLGKDAYLLDFMSRPEFKTLYGQYLAANLLSAIDAAGFVDALCQKAGITPANKQTLIDNLQRATTDPSYRDPAHTLEDFILTLELSAPGSKFYDRARIVMQYFGYLRRDPEPGGFDFWSGQLIGDSAPHKQDYRFMVGGFINSDEYRFRFALLSANLQAKNLNVNAGPDQTITLPNSATLSATISGTSNPLQISWSKVSGPGTIIFGNASSAATTAIFSAEGSYVPTLDSATQFLYTGANPIQTGVAPGTINPVRVAVVRGRVKGRDGASLPGVKVTVLDHAELGQTWTRADGKFDLAVNGGGLLTFRFEKVGLVSAERQLNMPWQDYVMLDDVLMVGFDNQVTAIDLQSSVPLQVARGGISNDADGTRQATLLFPAGTQATMVLPNGSTQPLSRMNVRATEFTVGPNGPRTMPGDLPATSAYTYAVEFSTDEAVALGATRVQFSQPVINYLENFLGFPIGISVPVGFYDPAKGVWVADQDGRVVRILSITGGKADLDVDGSNTAADASKLAALGVTEVERQQLASLYTAGQSLWRTPITHFSTPDLNYPSRPQEPAPKPSPDKAKNKDQQPKDPDCRKGSIIRCESQTLGEMVGITGTPFSLIYSSDRVPGRKASYILEIPLSGASVSPTLSRIELRITVAGRVFKQTFPAAPNQSYAFTWDGMDAYGRKLQGQQQATIEISYVYPRLYNIG